MERNKKVILITGGATGIGKAIAIEFAKRKFTVIVNYYKSERQAECIVNEIKNMGAEAIKVYADVSRSGDVKRMFKIVNREIGHLDILVNNAGWTKFVELRNLGKITEGMYQKIIDVNLKGVFLCSREAIKIMGGVSGALIINISSVSGIDGFGSNIIYCAAKAAVITMTKSFALAFGPHIRVNSIAPGFTNTRFISRVPKNILNREKRLTPLGRIAEPEDIAKVAAGLYEEMKFINGQTVIIDGGRCRIT